MRLLKKMPDDEVISLGDMVDRGPDSKAVIDWFMSNGRALMGNHEHMLLDYCRNTGFYEGGMWELNGGIATLRSFKCAIPDDVLAWLERLPLYMEIEGCLVSHSFVAPGYSLREACDLGQSSGDSKCERSIIWCRDAPKRMHEYRLQIAGHNSQFSLKSFSDEQGDFAICVDDSRHDRLTGIHLPSLAIYQVDY
jgi:hypothetical protein